MVIQRWQSLLLFISALIVGAGLVFPIGTQTVGVGVVDGTAGALVEDLYALDVMPLFILLCLSFVLILGDIFLYKNLRIQKQVALVSVLLTVVAGGVGAYAGSISAVVMMALSAVLTIVAYTRMRADERLLKSYDRIR